MEEELQQNGYIIQLYQYARKYPYNYENCINYFNYLIDNCNEVNESEGNNYKVLGDFDILEIIPINSFRKYHDVSDLAKKYLGRRQSVLLYRIDRSYIQYNSQDKCWCGKDKKNINKRFFCLSLLSITNEAHAQTNIFSILPDIRKKILKIVDNLNKRDGISESEELTCEVYGALNATEIGIVWLCNQYIDALLVIDYLKHMKLRFKNSDSKEEDISLFLASNTTITTKIKPLNETSFSDVKGSASVQISFHDKLEKRENVNELVKEIVDNNVEYKSLNSAGEYDLVIQMSASQALKYLEKNITNSKEDDGKHYKKELSYVLRNNTKLLFNKNEDKNEKLESELDKQEFILNRGSKEDRRLEDFLYLELINSDLKSNNVYYNEIREEMKKKIRPSAGAVDMFDLLYADYLSTIANAYNQIWVQDFHHQFKGVLHVIQLWLKYQTTSNLTNEYVLKQWADFSDLTNAFKQQVYHLSQSSRMVLDIPRCHFRMTGQYDLLIHTYYGFAKIILETIYLMQGKSNQSELIPLITVNTVPQVKSELYFEYGSSDEMRVINLNIPASIIFDPQRGLRYLAHELFHYAAPQLREKRNYLMGCFIISECFKMQFIHIFNQMLYTSVNGTIDKDLKDLLTKKMDIFNLPHLTHHIFFTNYRPSDKNNKEEYGKYWLDDEILRFIQSNAEKWRAENMIGCGKEDTCTEYQNKIFQYCKGEKSDELFEELSKFLMNYAYKNFYETFNEDNKDEIWNNIIKEYTEQDIEKKDLDKLFDRFKYCIYDENYYILQFHGLRRDYAGKEEIGKVIRTTLWNSIREACCDIAMVSLTSMTLDDYLLFCIQAWKDSNYDELDAEALEEDQWIRCGFVVKYFSQEEWNLENIDKFKEDFLKKYIWFYKKDQKTGICSKAEQWCEIFKIKSVAEQWWEVFKIKSVLNFGIKHFFFMPFYDPIFADILSDFDINKKVNNLSSEDLKKRLNNIQEDIRENVYKKYNSLLEKFLKKSEDLFFDLQNNKDYQNERFWCDLKVAQHFQKQKAFQELKEFNLEMQKLQKEEKCWNPKKEEKLRIEILPESAWKFHVRSLEELLFYLRYCERKIKKRDKDLIWFRGQSDEKFKLIPSIMRRYDEDKAKEYKSLRDYQQCEFEEFKYRADGAPEMPSGVRFTLSDYIALMQHYSVPTSLLDWSENAFFALYFALKYYFENSENKKKSVALYLLNPKKYNHLCHEEWRKGKNNEELNEKIKNQIFDSEKWIDYSIPNLSTKSNEEMFKAYLLGDLESENNNTSENFDENNIIPYLPIAILTSRLNARIRTQSGCFVAFNLYTLPQSEKKGVGGENHAFDYISLEEVQKWMINISPSEENIFLYKITIDATCCEDIMKWLSGMGISESSVYPELDFLKNRF